VTLVKEATGEDLSRGFHRDLSVAVSSRVNATAADLYDAIMAAAQANSLTQ